MSNDPRVALWGAGMISHAHAAACAALGWPITAVASRTADRAAERAAQLNATAMTYTEMVATPLADTAIVSTPPSRHADDTLGLLDAGWAVVVEKPLCTTLEAADALVDAAERPGRRLLYAENLAYSPIVGAFLKRTPELRTLTSLELRTLQGLPTWGDFTSPDWGGGVLFDLGAHPVALVLLVARAARAGRVVTIDAQLEGSSDGAHETDEWARVRLTFESGLQANVIASWRDGTQAVWDLQAASATGVLRAEILPATELEHNGDPVPLTTPTTEPNTIGRLGYVGQLAAFAEDMRHGRSPILDARFGRDVLELICAAYTSAGRNGRPIGLPFDGPRDLTPFQLWTKTA